MKKALHAVIITVALFSFCQNSYAVEAPTNKIILKTPFKIWEVPKSKLEFKSSYEKTFFDAFPVKISENDQALVKPYLQNKTLEGTDLAEIRSYLEQKIAPDIARVREDVTIGMDADGKVTFEGRGLYGRKLDIEKSAMMIKNALENNVAFVNLPMIRENPIVTVTSDKLKEMGITELISGGETYFSGSPVNRLHNIKTGLARFNGQIIKPNEEFSFGTVLGPVDQSTGYKPELVIKGDRVAPEYGGGLCQVSTTAYRAVLGAGLPVTQRRNHSFSVQYYSPTGLDATVYPPTVDFKFINDTPAHILMQSFMTPDAKAYYNFYGTKDDREVYLLGPYYFNYISPPPTRTEYSAKLAPGEKLVLGHAVPGISSSWFHYVIYGDDKKDENGAKTSFLKHIFSKYQARPEFFAIGTDKPVVDEKVAEEF